MKEIKRFVIQIIALLLLGLLLAFLTSCEKDEDTPPPVYTVVGDWKVDEWAVYLRDTTNYAEDGLFYKFRDNGYVIRYKVRDLDTIEVSSYKYVVEDSLTIFSNSYGVDYDLTLYSNKMIWENTISYDPISDTREYTRVTLTKQ